VPGFCRACDNFVDEFAPDAEPVRLVTRARTAAAGEVATTTEAFTYVPSEGPIRVDDVTVPSFSEEERLPYRFGTFQGAVGMVLGVCIAVFGLTLIGESVAGGLLVLVGSGAYTLLSYGVLKQKKIAVIITLALSAIVALASIAANPASAIGQLINIPIFYYYIKRLDQMD
jgi:hypothetical protein